MYYLEVLQREREIPKLIEDNELNRIVSSLCVKGEVLMAKVFVSASLVRVNVERKIEE